MILSYNGYWKIWNLTLSLMKMFAGSGNTNKVSEDISQHHQSSLALLTTQFDDSSQNFLPTSQTIKLFFQDFQDYDTVPSDI